MPLKEVVQNNCIRFVIRYTEVFLWVLLRILGTALLLENSQHRTNRVTNGLPEAPCKTGQSLVFLALGIDSAVSLLPINM